VGGEEGYECGLRGQWVGNVVGCRAIRDMDGQEDNVDCLLDCSDLENKQQKSTPIRI
jgi:hypothetical protein